MRVLAIRSPRAMCALPSMLTICSIRTTRSTAAMSRSPTITRLTSLAQESGACRWPSTSKIAIVEMKHLLPALLLAGLGGHRSEEHTSELQSLMRISYAVFCLKKKKNTKNNYEQHNHHL